MVRAIVIPHDAGLPLRVQELPGIGAFQEAVDGWIEAVDIPQFGVTIYVNEEGLVWRMPFNSRASFLWWHHEPRSRRSMLVGDAILVGLRDDVNDYSDVPSTVLDLLTTIQPFAVMFASSKPLDLTTEARISQVMLPLAAGDTRWLVSGAQYEDYFTAAAWAVVLANIWSDAGEIRIVPVQQLPQFLGQAFPT